MPSAYKSEEARARAMAAYDRALERWPVPVESRVVATSFGETHVLVSGPAQAPPLVLLHGGGGNATMWERNIGALASRLRVYMPDTIGDVGRSAATRPTYESDDHARWLGEALTGLGVERAGVAGASGGAWLTYRFALRFPERAARVALLAPPNFGPMPKSFLLRAIVTSLVPAPFLIRSFIRAIRSPRAPALPDWAVEDFVTRWKDQARSPQPIPPIGDDELTRLPAGSLVVLGRDEALYDAEKAAERVRRVAPSLRLVVLENAGHMITVDRGDEIDRLLLEFFA